jgi:magnesium-transporting ATPase (P-type)
MSRGALGHRRGDILNREKRQVRDVPEQPTILFTRRRWDRLFAIATLVMAIAAIVVIYLTGHLLYGLHPFVIMGLWAYVRRSTPAMGEHQQTIEGNPWTILLLVWLGFLCLITVGFFAFDILNVKHPINGPPQWYHWFFFVGMVIVTVGCQLIGNVSKRSRSIESDAEEKAD